MKESITKFDLEAAFKALDEIDIPATGKVKANRPALTEIFARKTKFDALMEDYYDISSTAELDDAKEAREAEVAKAKLARIEKIVDLDADSPEDLLTSYVGKYIIQCPQCMTLFYKNQEDVVESEDEPGTVNVNEVCQHCGNESGYTLIGKVGEADEGEFEPEQAEEAEVPEDLTIDEETAEEPAEEMPEEDLGDLEELDLNLEDDEEEKTEESFTAHEGEPLVEELSDDVDLDAKLDAHNEYIEYLRAAITNEEEKLEKATNEQVKVAIQRNIDAFKADLENALPDAVKDGSAIEEEPSDEETTEETDNDDTSIEEEPDVQEESCESVTAGEALTEALCEEADIEVSADEFEELISSPEFKKPISDSEARAMINDEKETEEDETPVKESKATHQCADCGHAFEHEEENFDGMCPACKQQHGSVVKLEEGVFDLFKTRAGKAEWILKNAMIDYTKAIIDKDGNAETKKENQKFAAFVVISYGNTDIAGKKIEKAPNPKTDLAKLVPNTKYPEIKAKYADAEKIAKGRSMKSDGGPAFIYLAKDANDSKAEFLCQYFDGKLDEASDRLDVIIENIKKDMKGAKLEVKGGSDQSEIRKVKADAVKPGMKIQLKDKTTAKIATVKPMEDPEGGSM